jgi:2-keto-4-pentenoate hydratase
MLESLARELIHAEVTRMPIAPLTQRLPALTKEPAYGIQSIVTDWRIAQGRLRVG